MGGHQGQLFPCLKKMNLYVEASPTYTAKGPTGKKKKKDILLEVLHLLLPAWHSHLANISGFEGWLPFRGKTSVAILIGPLA